MFSGVPCVWLVMNYCSSNELIKYKKIVKTWTDKQLTLTYQYCQKIHWHFPNTSAISFLHKSFLWEILVSRCLSFTLILFRHVLLYYYILAFYSGYFFFRCFEVLNGTIFCSHLTSALLQEFPNSSWSQFTIITYRHFYFPLGTSLERGKQNPRFCLNTPIQVIILVCPGLKLNRYSRFVNKDPMVTYLLIASPDM